MGDADGTDERDNQPRTASDAAPQRAATGPRPAVGANTTSPISASAPGGGASRPSAPGPAARMTGRRPIVDPSQRKRRREPFYAPLARLPRGLTIAVIAAVVLVPAAYFGYHAFDHARHADAYAVRQQLFAYKFDPSPSHFGEIDAMGPKGVEQVIAFLGDLAPAETDNGHSTTTTSDLAHQYLIYYAHKVGLEPPAKALDVERLGAVRQTAADWAEVKAQWTKWFADAHAKGKV